MMYKFTPDWAYTKTFGGQAADVEVGGLVSCHMSGVLYRRKCNITHRHSGESRNPVFVHRSKTPDSGSKPGMTSKEEKTCRSIFIMQRLM